MAFPRDLAPQRRLANDWRRVFQLAEGQTVAAGLENEQFDLTQINPEYGSTPYAENANRAAYREWRADFYKRFFLKSNVRYDDNAEFGSATTHRLVPAIIVPETKLKASCGTGFKAPSLEQLYVNYLGHRF
jgi:vitamin B12 transporter